MSKEKPDVLSVTVCNGKYTVILPANGGLKALRYGEEWRDLCGDGLILALAQEIEEKQQAILMLSQDVNEGQQVIKHLVETNEVLGEDISYLHTLINNISDLITNEIKRKS